MSNVSRRTSMQPGTCFELEVCPIIPAHIGRLQELADDLYYSWVNELRQLYAQLDRELWNQCGHNPKLFLRRISQDRLDAAAHDPIFLPRYSSALSAYDTYHRGDGVGLAKQWLSQEDLVAYFCAEFGFHESLPIYSGGLGILAGNHCKAASDLCLPFVAVGLSYRQGYFAQTIDAYGNQVATFASTDFSHLPISLARRASGQPVQVTVDLEGRRVVINVWRAKAGRVSLYLLDTDVPGNALSDRAITQQLYVADSHVRLRQEIVLGIGGVRALRALGLKPSVWHINEGHPAFVVLEHCREEVETGIQFDAALEPTAANTIFEGKLLLEGYDLALARRLIAGVDVWVNTPEYPLEARGTLGQKAALNGAINLSVLDGWWAEGFDGRNGWGIPPHHTTYADAADRDRIEAHEILDALEHEVVPLFFERNGQGYSEGWVHRSKASMQSILPRFNAQRMATDYVRDYYVPARSHRERLERDGGRAAVQLAAWRQRIAAGWARVQARRVDAHLPRLAADQMLKVLVAVRLGTLDIRDVRVECIFGRHSTERAFDIHHSAELSPLGLNAENEAVSSRETRPPLSGLQFYKLRVFPFHPLMRHPFEGGLMMWI